MKNILIGMVISAILVGGIYLLKPIYDNMDNLDKANLPKYSLIYDINANPNEDLIQALKKAKLEKKRVLIIAGGLWCKWCESLNNFFEENPKLEKDFFSKFEVVKVYYGNGISEKGMKFLRQFPVLKGTPHFYILNDDAKLLHSIDTTYLERGYSYSKVKLEKFITKYIKE